MRFHGIDSIVDEVEENLHELVAIAADTWKHGLQLQLDARLRRTIERAQLYRVGDDGIDVEECAFRRNLSRKAEKVANERFCSPGLIANFRRSGASLVGESLGRDARGSVAVDEGFRAGCLCSGGGFELWIAGGGGERTRRRCRNSSTIVLLQ